MSVTINPGTGPVPGGTVEDADSNMDVFAADLRDHSLNPTDIARDPDHDHEGRFGYRMNIGRRELRIEMPGLPIDQVRYVADEGQDIWDFPRLYVDDSSWIWMFAIRACEPMKVDRPRGDQDSVLDEISDAATADEQPAPGS